MSIKEDPQYDVELWFTMGTHCEGRHYVFGNPHTFPGRMMGWCPKKGGTFFFSLAEVDEASPLARAWMAGFLCGNEPAPPRSESGIVDFASDAYKRWEDKAASFRADGYWAKDDASGPTRTSDP